MRSFLPAWPLSGLSRGETIGGEAVALDDLTGILHFVPLDNSNP